MFQLKVDNKIARLNKFIYKEASSRIFKSFPCEKKETYLEQEIKYFESKQKLYKFINSKWRKMKSWKTEELKKYILILSFFFWILLIRKSCIVLFWWLGRTNFLFACVKNIENDTICQRYVSDTANTNFLALSSVFKE